MGIGFGSFSSIGSRYQRTVKNWAKLGSAGKREEAPEGIEMPDTLKIWVAALACFALFLTVRWYREPIDEKDPKPIPIVVLVSLGIALWLVVLFN